MLNPFPYDRLYRESRNYCLWGSRPGRLVKYLEHIECGNRVLDAGCGDGKNSIFLEEMGYQVTGFDVSSPALMGLSNRFQRSHRAIRGLYVQQDIRELRSPRCSYDVLISYGLYHCLTFSARHNLHLQLQNLARVGGVVLFTCLTDRLPMPLNHGTGKILLASQEEVIALFDGWEIIHFSEGVIHESHPPVVGPHEHSAVWVLARRL